MARDMFCRNGRNDRVCVVKSNDSDPLVKNGLAVTPHRMFELVQQGIPISEQAAGIDQNFTDGYTGGIDFEPPACYQRGADIISNFYAQRDARQQVGEFLKSQESTNAD